MMFPEKPPYLQPEAPIVSKPGFYSYFQLGIAVLGVLLFILTMHWKPSLEGGNGSDNSPLVFVMLVWYVYPWLICINIVALVLLNFDKENHRKSLKLISWGTLIMVLTVVIWLGNALYLKNKYGN